MNQGICFFTYHGKVGLASPIDCATSLDANSSACSWTWQATNSEQEWDLSNIPLIKIFLYYNPISPNTSVLDSNETTRIIPEGDVKGTSRRDVQIPAHDYTRLSCNSRPCT